MPSQYQNKHEANGYQYYKTKYSNREPTCPIQYPAVAPPPPYSSRLMGSRPSAPTAIHPTNQAPPKTNTTQQLTPQQQVDANRLYRQIVRRTTRNTLGIGTSSAMATVFPYMLGPAAASGYGLYRARKTRREVIDGLEKRGFQVRKRDLANGIAVGTLQKLPLTFLLWGHDEVLFGLSSLVETYPGAEHLFSGAVETVGAHADALDVPIIDEANGLAAAPVDMLHEIFGIDGAEERVDAAVEGQADTGGWHDNIGNVAQDLLFVAPAAAAVDQAADYPFEKWDKRKASTDSRSSHDVYGTSLALPPRPKRN